MRSSHRGLIIVFVLLVCALASRAAVAQSRSYGPADISRRYNPYEPTSRAVYDYREPPSYAASRRSWDPYTPYYNRPAVWPYYPGYYGGWHYGPYGYRYGFSPWFGGYGRYSAYGHYHWPNSWRIAEVGPAPFDRLDYAWRSPIAPFGPAAMISPVDVGRGFPAVPAAAASGECYYW
ncbi:MAG: hypothetical protein SGJ19_02435 [Planctomycetia bacterium]|nr:hypothetical protein [Planctomycetia bacterium]